MNGLPLHIVSIILVTRAGDKFLLVQRSPQDKIFPGKWQNPGGKIELGETVEQTIKRELKEETGIILETQPIFLQSYSWKKDENDPSRLGLIFLINLKKSPQSYRISIGQELINFGWFTIKEAKNLDLIGKNSPTGTYGQLLMAEKQTHLIHKRNI